MAVSKLNAATGERRDGARIEHGQQSDAPSWCGGPTKRGSSPTLRDDGRLRLVVVQDGAEPPISGDPLEDWVRSSDSASIPDRIAGLVARAGPLLTPSLDASGVLRVGARWTPLLRERDPDRRRLVDGFGSIVPSATSRARSARRAGQCRPRRPRCASGCADSATGCASVGLDLRAVPVAGTSSFGSRVQRSTARASRDDVAPCRDRSGTRGPASAHVSVTDVLLDILIVLVAAKLAAEIAERINVPAVVGEIVAGVHHRPVGARPRRIATRR